MEAQKTLTTQSNPEQKEQSRRQEASQYLISRHTTKAMVTKTVWYWYKDKKTKGIEYRSHK
jgi:hypothetical protein